MNRLLVIRDWYQGRTSRERWLIALMLAIAVPLLAYVAVYQPLMSALDTARERHVAAVRQHGLVLSRLAQLEGAGRPAPLPAGTAPLALRVTEAAAQAGVALSANEPRGGGSVVITLAPSLPTAALRWLRELEAKGITVRELTVTPQGNGQVAVSATLSQGGAQ